MTAIFSLNLPLVIDGLDDKLIYKHNLEDVSYQMDKESNFWPLESGGALKVVGREVRLPGLHIIKEIGRGSNAVVFEAKDELLARTVAVKIWNSKGLERAQFETAKIAQLEHPLIVRTYQFNWFDGCAYSVMELVAGVSGKYWLTQKPSIESRVSVWRLYSTALRFIYSSGEIHGDPHLGNVLVFPDINKIYGGLVNVSDKSVGVKIADMGTSEFWNSKDKMRHREGTIILETARRLFGDQNLERLWFHPSELTYRATLDVLDQLCEFISYNCGFIFSDRAANNASKLVELVMRVPLFNLSEVVDQIGKSGFTTRGRFARRLNQKLFNVFELMDARDIIDDETERQYEAVRNLYLEQLVALSVVPANNSLQSTALWGPADL